MRHNIVFESDWIVQQYIINILDSKPIKEL